MAGVKPDEENHTIMISPFEPRTGVPTEDVPLNQCQSFRISYVPQSQLENFRNTLHNHVLALVDYGRTPPTRFDSKGLHISIDMEQYVEPNLTEVWTSSSAISTNQANGVHMAFNGTMAAGHVQCEEFDGIPLEEVVGSAYTRILETLSALGYPHLFRMWNYFPAINAEQTGLERYKRFCIGRHHAFFKRFREYKWVLPAASAVGTRSGPFQVYFLAGKPKAVHIENPRQISAYDYPSIYGPKSPSFARATLASMPSWSPFFIAGTASIVGHNTQHEGDLFKQTNETVSNLNALLDHAKKDNDAVLGGNPSLNLLKVYVRHEQHIKSAKEVIEHHFGHRIPTLYLQGEMCRKDLLVEIEALYTGERLS